MVYYIIFIILYIYCNNYSLSASIYGYCYYRYIHVHINIYRGRLNRPPILDWIGLDEDNNNNSVSYIGLDRMKIIVG
jgi:hypothetical protein